MCLSSPLALAQSFYWAPDVPTTFSGSTFGTNEAVLRDAPVATHTTELAFPGGPPIAALHRLDAGDWLLAVASATTLTTSSGAATFDVDDVVRFTPATGFYASFFDGGANGIPAGTAIDAVFVDGGDAGDLVLSVDVPCDLGAASTTMPADLVRFDGAFTTFFDAGAAGIASSSNLVGADVRGGRIAMTFDVPTTVGATTFLPGDVAEWDSGSGFATLFSDPTWPRGSQMRAFAFLADPGRTPGTIVVHTAAAGQLRITWQPTCSVADDYGIYEGVVGTYGVHDALDCSDDGGDLTELITPNVGDRYFLVVPHNANDEGSYGAATAGERPVGGTRCVATQAIHPCP